MPPKLPPLLDQVRKHLPRKRVPSIAYYIPPGVEPPPEINKAEYESDDEIPLLCINNLWIEDATASELGGTYGILFFWDEYETELQVRMFHELQPKVAAPLKFNLRNFRHELETCTDPEEREALRTVGNLFLRVCHQLWKDSQRTREPSVVTYTHTRRQTFERVGNSIRYINPRELGTTSRLYRNYEPPEPGSSGIRKREHEVREHWRVYKSGVRVKVKAHTRGDPELGRSTRVIR